MLTISQLASYAGVTVRAVRHYHAKGLLPEPERDYSGYRRYDAKAVVELIKIRTLAQAGVPLARVQELLGAEHVRHLQVGQDHGADSLCLSVAEVLDDALHDIVALLHLDGGDLAGIEVAEVLGAGPVADQGE